MPDSAALPVPQAEDVVASTRKILSANDKAFRIPNAIEMEEVMAVTLSPGFEGGPQKIGNALPPHKWSNDSQFFARANKVGDSATFTFAEQYQPRRMIVYPTISHDYGILDFYVNGKWVKRGWDGYDPASHPGAPIDLGVRAPDGNVIRIKVEVAGKNPKSTGYHFGIDAVELRNPEETQ